MRRIALALAVAVLSGMPGCAIVGQVETTTVSVSNGTAEINSRRLGGAVRCRPQAAGEAPCRAEAP